MEMHNQASQSLPTARDLEVYRLAKVERHSTRVIAKILGVSQTRVRQLIDRAEAYMLAVAPDSKDKTLRAKCVRVAEQLAAERVDFLYGEAVQRFHEQEGKVKGNKGPQYLLAAGRMALLGSKLPVSKFESLIAATADDEDDCLGGETNEAGLSPE